MFCTFIVNHVLPNAQLSVQNRRVSLTCGVANATEERRLEYIDSGNAGGVAKLSARLRAPNSFADSI